MLRRIPAFIRPRPFSGLPLSCGHWEVSVAALPAARSGAVRTEHKIQRHFCTSRSICSKKDDQSVPANEISQKAAESQGRAKETLKKDLLDVIKDMKVDLDTVNVRTTKPRGRKLSDSLETTVGRLQKAPEDPPKKSGFLSPELVAAASAVADSLPFDKQTTKSELLRQLQQHEEKWRAQKDREKHGISFTDIISNMKIAKSASVRASTRPLHQIEFDEEMDSSLDQKKSANSRGRYSGFVICRVLFV